MEEEITLLGTYANITEASIDQNILNLSGIESSVSDANLSFDNSVPGHDFGGVRLMVRTEDLQKAKQALHEQRMTGAEGSSI
jgi:hypothetical protein